MTERVRLLGNGVNLVAPGTEKGLLRYSHSDSFTDANVNTRRIQQTTDSDRTLIAAIIQYAVHRGTIGTL